MSSETMGNYGSSTLGPWIKVDAAEHSYLLLSAPEVRLIPTPGRSSATEEEEGQPSASAVSSDASAGQVSMSSRRGFSEFHAALT